MKYQYKLNQEQLFQVFCDKRNCCECPFYPYDDCDKEVFKYIEDNYKQCKIKLMDRLGV